MFSFLLYFIRPSTEKGHASLTNEDGKMQIWVRLFQVYFRENIRIEIGPGSLEPGSDSSPAWAFNYFLKNFNCSKFEMI